jgi:hypothetical protein
MEAGMTTCFIYDRKWVIVRECISKLKLKTKMARELI